MSTYTKLSLLLILFIAIGCKEHPTKIHQRIPFTFNWQKIVTDTFIVHKDSILVKETSKGNVLYFDGHDIKENINGDFITIEIKELIGANDCANSDLRTITKDHQLLSTAGSFYFNISSEDGKQLKIEPNSNSHLFIKGVADPSMKIFEGVLDSTNNLVWSEMNENISKNAQSEFIIKKPKFKEKNLNPYENLHNYIQETEQLYQFDSEKNHYVHKVFSTKKKLEKALFDINILPVTNSELSIIKRYYYHEDNENIYLRYIYPSTKETRFSLEGDIIRDIEVYTIIAVQNGFIARKIAKGNQTIIQEEFRTKELLSIIQKEAKKHHKQYKASLKANNQRIAKINEYRRNNQKYKIYNTFREKKNITSGYKIDFGNNVQWTNIDKYYDQELIVTYKGNVVNHEGEPLRCSIGFYSTDENIYNSSYIDIDEEYTISFIKDEGYFIKINATDYFEYTFKYDGDPSKLKKIIVPEEYYKLEKVSMR
ncbi:hypothetical protein [Flammeovirga agarivorans]|uniref:Lipoprotein n=1 Tax=Flammeovirga agarivorans TaxID=2726742 RepID=A0A7X8SQL8_9BACT|nr:hypothetical protein [Flammeovirga agarivorans]NLR94602.1 hypothetical protein [Flammeovirga agarivorans]